MRGVCSSRTSRNRPLPPGNTSPASSSKFFARRGERLLERLRDLAVRVSDHRTQLTQRRLQVGAPRLELLDVGERLRVLLLRERVHGTELLAPARQPLHAVLESPRVLLGQRLHTLLAVLRHRQIQPLGDPAQLLGGLARLVAQALGGDLRAGHLLAQGAQARLDLGLLLRARAQLAGYLLAGRTIA